MGYYVSNMIGIRTGGVFSINDKLNVEEFKERIYRVIDGLKDTEHPVDIPEGGLDKCMSVDLVGHKGSYVVIAGVFNYWNFRHAAEFARRLSEEFGTHVMLMSWDEEIDNVACQVFDSGGLLGEAPRFDSLLRRVE